MPQLSLWQRACLPCACLSPRGTRPTFFFFFLPTVLRAESRWRSAAAAGEQCLDAEDRNKRRSWEVKQARPERAVVMNW